MKTKSSTVTAAPVAPAAGLKQINLARIATTAPAAKAAKTYPELPDPDGQVAALVEGILEKSEQLEALEGSLSIEKDELIAIAKPFYFAHHAGQMAVASSVEQGRGQARADRALEFLPRHDRRCCHPACHGRKGAEFFKQSFEFKIKGDLIPETAAEEIIGELQALFARHTAGAALSAKAVFKPTKEFLTTRHTLYSAEENMEIDKVAPFWASVKTKLGRGGSGEE